MTAPIPSRAAIDAAEPLDFTPRRPKADLTITVKATIDGFPVEICFTGALDQLEAITRRLRDLGASPAGVHQIAPAAQPARTPAARTTPAYDGDGQALCPTHKRALKEGKWGLYCSAKDQETGEYCKLKFTE